jgi:thiamine biosynthesis lipoprotein
MGTVFTIDVRDSGDWRQAIDDVVAWLHSVDATFSTYRPNSDINRLRRGELRLADARPDVAAVLDRCAELQQATDGWFSAQPDGALDPTGVVKGWAIERASRLLREAGSEHHIVSGGGDMQVAGEAGEGRPWVVGISNPRGADVLCAIEARDCAVATSGVAERGRHIVDPFTGRAADSLLAVTVVGPALTEVDAYATAAFAMGRSARAWLEGLDGHEGLVVEADGSAGATSGWPRLLAAA